MLIESLIPPVQSLLSSFIFFLTLFCFTGFSSVLVKLPPFSVKEEDRLYFPIIQGTS
jgi:ABC-type microcin C transport system permease subunit YejE